MLRRRTPGQGGRGAGGSRQRVLHLSLRARITLGFALGALTLSCALAAITYFTTRSQIVSQELSALESQASANATKFYNTVSARPSPGILNALSAIDASSNAGRAPGGSSLYYSSTTSWVYATPLEIVPETDLPGSIISRVTDQGDPAYQVFSFASAPWVVVGIPIDGLKGDFFQVFSLTDTARTLHIILAALGIAGLVTTIGGAVVGRWAAGFALRPLREVSQAALAIASGRLGTRLETGDAPDLAVLASSFNRMVDRLQQRIERDARFTSDVSHELRSPLTTLANALSVMETRRDELPDRSRQALELIGAEVRRFQRMVGELLEISRLDAGSADFEESVLPIGEVVRRAVAAAGGQDLLVDVDPEVEGRKVVVDKRRFERIVANLIENAERYGGGATRVAVQGREANVRMTVEDDGPGVPPGERERIFERFARGSVAAGRRGAGGGTGLGLALVQEHVKLHGGRVWVEDRDPAGSSFVVELPFAPPHVLDEAEVAPGEEDPAPPAIPAAAEDVDRGASATRSGA